MQDSVKMKLENLPAEILLPIIEYVGANRPHVRGSDDLINLTTCSKI